MLANRRLLWVLVIVLLVIILAWALDHLFFPDLPTPSGVPSITKGS